MKAFFFQAPFPLVPIEPNQVLQWYVNVEGTYWTVPSTPVRYYVLHYLSARNYVQSVILPNLRQQFSDAQVEKVVDRPDLSQTYQVLSVTDHWEAVDIVVTYRAGGIKMKAGYTVRTRRYNVQGSIGGNLSFWEVYLMGCQSPENAFDGIQSIYSIFMPTFRVNPKWLQVEMEGHHQRGEMISASMQKITDTNYRMRAEQSKSNLGNRAIIYYCI